LLALLLGYVGIGVLSLGALPDCIPVALVLKSFGPLLCVSSRSLIGF
jgi:hypothetical protein